MPQVLNSRKFYNYFAEEFDAYSQKKQLYLDAVDSLVISECQPGLNILDVGSGTGTRIARLSRFLRAKKIVCVDSSDGMAKKCAGHGFATLLHDISEGPITQSGQFDLALCLWNVLGHIRTRVEREKVLENIYSSMRSGAKLILDVNNRYNIESYGKARVFKNILLDAFGFSRRNYYLKLGQEKIAVTAVHLFTKKEILKTLKRAGFEIRSVCYFNYFNGQIEFSSWLGQIVIVAKKP